MRIGIVAPFDQITPEEFKRVIDVNLNGQAYGAMVALPHLKQGGGALIHVSSLAARVPFPLQNVYAASKHGIAGFWDGMEFSRKLISKNWFSFLGFAFALVLLNLTGILLLGMGLLVTIPISACAIAAAYADMVGLPPSSSDF